MGTVEMVLALSSGIYGEIINLKNPGIETSVMNVSVTLECFLLTSFRLLLGCTFQLFEDLTIKRFEC